MKANVMAGNTLSFFFFLSLP
ncbi:protein of unknown function (plasmid) [Cupriavidus neocaledonicus]|uniref:Uncharacterized protein n=1 Tax=Cupriavidus neocaledonicus TaxID=1040979 RepID=A0A375HPR9_9BURK|nr:protein of unknown function [Cupriavidus neocaledonicus]